MVSFFSLSSPFDLPILCCQFFSCLFVWFLVVFQSPFTGNREILCCQFFSCLFVWFLVVFPSPFTENREISFQRHFLQFSVMESGFLGLFSAFALG